MTRLCVIGSGFGKAGLVPAFAGIRNCEVTACVSGREWERVLTRGGIDAVAIAVPPSEQYKIARCALEKGLHVFAEKPLATSVQEARHLLKLARKHNQVHGIDFMFPEINAWKMVKQLLVDESVGKLRHISVRWCWLSNEIRFGRSTWRTDHEQGGGMTSFYFSHGFHYLQHFAGPIVEIDGKRLWRVHSGRKQEVGFDALIGFQNGTRASVHVSSEARHIEHSLTFECERGTIVLASRNAIVDNFSVTLYEEGKVHKVNVAKETSRHGEDERVKIVRKLARRFIAACHGKGTMYPSFEDGLNVQRAIQLAKKRLQ